jgi:hypothetical protein
MSHRPAPLVGRKGLTLETRKGRCAALEKRREKGGENEKEKKEEKKERGGKKNQ